jgi:hypothetical protein
LGACNHVDFTVKSQYGTVAGEVRGTGLQSEESITKAILHVCHVCLQARLGESLKSGCTTGCTAVELGCLGFPVSWFSAVSRAVLSKSG